jgi:glycosyltransferase involved in cell wall biosynthesis
LQHVTAAGTLTFRQAATGSTKLSATKPLPKVLLVAEHASAVFGGEALIPFQYFKHLRECGVDVHLVVHARTRNELLEAFQDRQRLHFVSDSIINIWCYKLSKLLPDRISDFTVNAISHFDTQIRQRILVKTLLRANHFDVVHEPIPVSPKLPSALYGLSVPLIVGPMNGGMNYPPSYNKNLFEGLIVHLLRSTAALGNFLIPGKRGAALLIVANQRTYDALPTSLKSRPISELVENGVDTQLFRPHTKSPAGSTLRLIHIGRLVDFKRVDLLLEACSRLISHLDFHVDLVGDGPLREVLEEQTRQLGLTSHVRFHGRLPQAAAADLLRCSDLMVFPSMRDCGGAVVLEAMACGVAVVATKWGGPIDYVTQETGLLIPPETPDRFITQLSEAILWMAKNPESRARMSQSARRRAEEFYDWRRKTSRLITLYQDVLSGQDQARRSRLQVNGSRRK